jgi:undecaprenyl-diphosphatase
MIQLIREQNNKSDTSTSDTNSDKYRIESIMWSIIIILLFISFIILTVLVFSGKTEAFDNWLLMSFGSPESAVFESLIYGFSYMGTLIIIFLLPFVLIWLYKNNNKRGFYFCALILLCSQLTAISLKLIIARPRPILLFSILGESYSFPSGHVLSAVCFYSFLAITLNEAIDNRIKKAIIWLSMFFIIVLISISRLVMNVHYPTDIFASLILGSLLVIILYRTLDNISSFFSKFRKKIKRNSKPVI